MSNHREYLEARNKEIRQLRRDGLTLREIGEMYGVTREAIRLVCKGIPKPDLKTYIKKNCIVCNKEFVVCGDKKRNKTCSKACFKAKQKFSHYKDGKWSNDDVTLTCAGCGKEFTRTKKLIEIAKHSYVSRGRDLSSKKWYCGRDCNLKSIHSGNKNESED